MKNAKENKAPEAGNPRMPFSKQTAKPTAHLSQKADLFYYHSFMEALPQPLNEMVRQQLEFFRKTATRDPEVRGREDTLKMAREEMEKMRSAQDLIDGEIRRFKEGAYSPERNPTEYGDALARLCFTSYLFRKIREMYTLVLEKDRDNLTFVFYTCVKTFCNLVSGDYMKLDSRIIHYHFWNSGLGALMAVCAEETGVHLAPPSLVHLEELDHIAREIGLVKKQNPGA